MSDANNQDTVTKTTNISSSTGVKRKRGAQKTRSGVWLSFTKLETKPEEVPQCKCNHCGCVFACATANGTSSLSRHLKRCLFYKKQSSSAKQQVLSFTNVGLGPSSDGIGSSINTWKFDQEQSRKDLAKFIIMTEMPFRIVENETFKTFVSNLQPRFKFVSRVTVKKDCILIYETEKNKLREMLRTSSQRVSLTSDMWTSVQQLGYLSLTAHFIDSEWKLQKKILNFSMVESSHTGENLANVIMNRLMEWNIEKLCTITLDNCSTNDVIVRSLVEHFGSKDRLLVRGRMLHVRCWAHILNLIVQDGLSVTSEHISKIRNCVKYIKSSQRRKRDFLEYVKQEGIEIRKGLRLDVVTRWNSTYLMLESALYYRKAFNRLKAGDSSFKDAPSFEDWDEAEVICQCLELFYNATNVFSGSKYSTSNLFFHEIFGIQVALLDMSKSLDETIYSMSVAMQKKFNKYWEEKDCNILLVIAVVLDPRYKLDFVKFCYSRIYSDLIVQSYMSRITSSLYELFNEYTSNQQASSSIADHIGTNPSKVVEAKMAISNAKKKATFRKEFYKTKQEEDSSGCKSELDVYLKENLHNTDDVNSEEVIDDNFDILSWWKVNSSRYRVLSMMARDVLAVPVSTVASESAFSTGGRVLDPHRSSMSPSTVEGLICAQDWLRREVTFDEDDECDIISDT